MARMERINAANPAAETHRVVDGETDGCGWSPPTAVGAGPVRLTSLSSFTESQKYQILRRVGKGAFGEVWAARCQDTGKLVAVKFFGTKYLAQILNIPSNLSDADEARGLREAISNLEDCRRQGAAASRIPPHPNVANIYGMGTAEIRGFRVCFLVYEFIDGKDLEHVEKPLRWPQALCIALQLSSGLEAAHSAHVVHRDIKPANVMITSDGIVKLLDFGLARFNLVPRSTSLHDLARLTGADDADTSLLKSGSFVGSPSYMAPEVWEIKGASEAADVYSFGVLLYELCSGMRPYNGSTFGELARAVLGSTPTPLAALVPSIMPAFAELIMRCLRRDPTERFSSGLEVNLALQTIYGSVLAAGVSVGELTYRG